jgi:hypothetical protein
MHPIVAVSACTALLVAGCGSSGSTAPSPSAPPQVISLGEEPAEIVAPPAAQAKDRARPKPPAGYVEVTVGGVVSVDDGHAVVLVDEEQGVAVPIFIGGTEALSIELRHNKRRYARPLTHDLLDSVMRELGGELVKIHIDDIRDSTFIGAVFVRRGDRVAEIDARPSDAIALAIGKEVPIFVARKVIQEAGIRRDELMPGSPPDVPGGPQPI